MGWWPGLRLVGCHIFAVMAKSRKLYLGCHAMADGEGIGYGCAIPNGTRAERTSKS